VEDARAPASLPPPGGIEAMLVEALALECGVEAYGLAGDDFRRILLRVGTEQNYGQAPGATASTAQQAAFFRSLRIADLVLARACASGQERAWEHFLGLYRQPLARAAVAIAGSETEGEELAGALYAELYGLTSKDGERRCPLDSYRGRGSLIGWLRTILAQRHVDHFRRHRREEPLEDFDAPAPAPTSDPESPQRSGQLASLSEAIEGALQRVPAEERFLLVSYYLDERTLSQIAEVLHIHEATVSRRLRRTIDELRKQVLKNLQALGFSRRAAQEALGTDPRDPDVNLKKWMQYTQSETFQEKAAP
jgi:RNA polymerase sigma-70 factor (ECF subfamily)